MTEQVTEWDNPDLFQYAYDMSPDSITIADARGNILMTNARSCEVSGYSREELIGKNSLDFILPEEREQAIARLTDVFVKGEVKNLVSTYVKKDGSHLYIEYTVRWFNNFPGIGPCSISIGRDISDKVMYEKAYKDFLNQTLHGLVVIQDTKIVYANQVLLKSLGYSEEEIAQQESKHIFHLVHPEDKHLLLEKVNSLKKLHDSTGEFSFRLFGKNGEIHWVVAALVRTTYHGKPALQVAVLDITRRKAVEDALRENMQRYQALAESSPDGIYIIDKNEVFVYVNESGAKMLGKDPSEIIGKPRVALIPDSSSNHLRQARRKVFETGLPERVEDLVPTSEGQIWFSTWFVPLKNEQGEVTEVMGIARNVHDRKQKELSLKNAKQELEQRVKKRTSELVASQEQLKRLTQQIVTTQEEERRRVARELHDETGQALITLKYNMASLRDELMSEHPDIAKRIGNAMVIVDETTRQIRTISHSLRPPVLDIAGIDLSLADYCTEFTSRTRIPVTYSGVNIPNLTEEIGISLYRILQEALTNIAKHADATEVNVSLEYENEEICLTVRDNGRGFDFHAVTDGIGLVGMQERIGLLGGKLEINTEPGQGTSLLACVTWKGDGAK